MYTTTALLHVVYRLTSKGITQNSMIIKIKVTTHSCKCHLELFHTAESKVLENWQCSCQFHSACKIVTVRVITSSWYSNGFVFLLLVSIQQKMGKKKKAIDALLKIFEFITVKYVFSIQVNYRQWLHIYESIIIITKAIHDTIDFDSFVCLLIKVDANCYFH